MRRAANFNPEWGYLAPAPTFMRSARLVLVATAIGASAGAAVVFSLIDRPVAEQSVAARTLVQTPLVSEFGESRCADRGATANRIAARPTAGGRARRGSTASGDGFAGERRSGRAGRGKIRGDVDDATCGRRGGLGGSSGGNGCAAGAGGQ